MLGTWSRTVDLEFHVCHKIIILKALWTTTFPIAHSLLLSRLTWFTMLWDAKASDSILHFHPFLFFKCMSIYSNKKQILLSFPTRPRAQAY